MENKPTIGDFITEAVSGKRGQIVEITQISDSYERYYCKFYSSKNDEFTHLYLSRFEITKEKQNKKPGFRHGKENNIL